MEVALKALYYSVACLKVALAWLLSPVVKLQEKLFLLRNKLLLQKSIILQAQGSKVSRIVYQMGTQECWQIYSKYGLLVTYYPEFLAAVSIVGYGTTQVQLALVIRGSSLPHHLVDYSTELGGQLYLLTLPLVANQQLNKLLKAARNPTAAERVGLADDPRRVIPCVTQVQSKEDLLALIGQQVAINQAFFTAKTQAKSNSKADKQETSNAYARTQSKSGEYSRVEVQANQKTSQSSSVQEARVVREDGAYTVPQQGSTFPSAQAIAQQLLPPKKQVKTSKLTNLGRKLQTTLVARKVVSWSMQWQRMIHSKNYLQRATEVKKLQSKVAKLATLDWDIKQYFANYQGELLLQRGDNAYAKYARYQFYYQQFLANPRNLNRYLLPSLATKYAFLIDSKVNYTNRPFGEFFTWNYLNEKSTTNIVNTFYPYGKGRLTSSPSISELQPYTGGQFSALKSDLHNHLALGGTSKVGAKVKETNTGTNKVSNAESNAIVNYRNLNYPIRLQCNYLLEPDHFNENTLIFILEKLIHRECKPESLLILAHNDSELSLVAQTLRLHLQHYNSRSNTKPTLSEQSLEKIKLRTFADFIERDAIRTAILKASEEQVQQRQQRIRDALKEFMLKYIEDTYYFDFLKSKETFIALRLDQGKTREEAYLEYEQTRLSYYPGIRSAMLANFPFAQLFTNRSDLRFLAQGQNRSSSNTASSNSSHGEQKLSYWRSPLVNYDQEMQAFTLQVKETPLYNVQGRPFYFEEYKIKGKDNKLSRRFPSVLKSYGEWYIATRLAIDLSPQVRAEYHVDTAYENRFHASISAATSLDNFSRKVRDYYNEEAGMGWDKDLTWDFNLDFTFYKENFLKVVEYYGVANNKTYKENKAKKEKVLNHWLGGSYCQGVASQQGNLYNLVQRFIASKGNKLITSYCPLHSEGKFFLNFAQDFEQSTLNYFTQYATSSNYDQRKLMKVDPNPNLDELVIYTNLALSVPHQQAYIKRRIERLFSFDLFNEILVKEIDDVLCKLIMLQLAEREIASYVYTQMQHFTLFKELELSNNYRKSLSNYRFSTVQQIVELLAALLRNEYLAFYHQQNSTLLQQNIEKGVAAADLCLVIDTYTVFNAKANVHTAHFNPRESYYDFYQTVNELPSYQENLPPIFSPIKNHNPKVLYLIGSNKLYDNYV